MQETPSINTSPLELKGILEGHNGAITSITTSPDNPDLILSASRDKSILVWNITHNSVANLQDYGIPQKRLKGHSHIVSDVTLSKDAQYALSSSWDGTLRLWDLSTGNTSRRFIGHSKDVLSVAFSDDNRQIVSGGRDNRINLWNTLGELKYSIGGGDSPLPKQNLSGTKSSIGMGTDGHNDWVSCVRFSPNVDIPLIVSGSYDKKVKVFSLSTCKLKTNLLGHTGLINTVTVSPDGSLCASGGNDGIAMLWDLNETKHLSSLENEENIYSLCFSPIKYWLCVAAQDKIKIWDLETKKCLGIIAPEIPSTKKSLPISCTCLAWSGDGTTLYAGYSDKKIRVWGVNSSMAV